ncbi:hypothetical protein [Pseudoduganella lutea]|uniref:Uncharacterized protein n=1 Tax=Pseudoduganella lutea TaxID=321985 RepID=A0A4P6L1V7_9BURK|nr:hypothetical protein [Pseudoduganella lutea]QBE65357.1 hypothetical protein EWM63_22135 [Pseudoduganella lutea]
MTDQRMTNQHMTAAHDESANDGSAHDGCRVLDQPMTWKKQEAPASCRAIGADECRHRQAAAADRRQSCQQSAAGPLALTSV